jgi:hypothetical protein
MKPSDPTHLKSLVISLANIIQPDIYLELGVQFGDTIKKVHPYTKRAIGVDIKKQFVNSNAFEFYEMTTNTFFEKVKSKEIDLPFVDLVFIDADHSYEAAAQDFNNVFPLVSDQGLILMHDTYPRNVSETVSTLCGTVYKIAWEIRNTRKDCEIVTIPCFPGLSILRKSSRQTLKELK